mgnify:CR=1 FL=1
MIQSQVAQAEAQLRSARLFLVGSLEEIWRAVEPSGILTLDQRHFRVLRPRHVRALSLLPE